MPTVQYLKKKRSVIIFKYHYKKGFEPWMYTWDGREETLKDGCYSGSNLHFCTALIRANNWTIPKDYPYKVH